MIEETRRECECGNYLVTNDPYMLDAWDEWHAEGAFLAGSYHKRLDGYDVSKVRAEVAQRSQDALSVAPREPRT